MQIKDEFLREFDETLVAGKNASIDKVTGLLSKLNLKMGRKEREEIEFNVGQAISVLKSSQAYSHARDIIAYHLICKYAMLADRDEEKLRQYIDGYRTVIEKHQETSSLKRNFG